MSGYDYLKNSHKMYNPRTPRAALLAVESGLLPQEAYIYKANSIKPLFEEPVDIPEIERILASENNDLTTNLLLIGILERLLVNKDSEIALFAAESINAIEGRYNDRIEGLKARYRHSADPSILRDIAHQFFEIGTINLSRPVIREFYYAESYTYMKNLQLEGKLLRIDVDFLLVVLLELKLYTQAEEVLASLKSSIRNETRYLFVEAEIAFLTRNYGAVFTTMKKIKEQEEVLTEELKESLDQWIPSDE